MKVTKFVHSCLLVEKDGKRILVDPGNYSWDSGSVDTSQLDGLDYVCVTHAHPDHIIPTFAEEIKKRSPKAVWFCTPSTARLLESLGISSLQKSNKTIIKFIKSEHEDLYIWNSCEDHTSFLLFGELLVSGDTQHHKSFHGARILAGPINGGPWGAIMGELKLIGSLPERPEKFIPLHDWHWNEGAKAAFYANLPSTFEKLGVEFISVVDGVPTEV